MIIASADEDTWTKTLLAEEAKTAETAKRHAKEASRSKDGGTTFIERKREKEKTRVKARAKESERKRTRARVRARERERGSVGKIFHFFLVLFHKERLN